MLDQPRSHTLTSLAALDAHYGAVSPMAIVKETPVLIPEYRAMLDASPFCVIATSGPGGIDCSPRGDPPGFVHVEDDATIMIPDRPGNNRLDSYRNIIGDPRVALMFLIPGHGEALRINGTAAISIDPTLCQRFAMNDRPARAVLVVTVGAVYFQCRKALIRSKLWEVSTWGDLAHLPSAGRTLEAAKAFNAASIAFDGETYDAVYPERMRNTIY